MEGIWIEKYRPKNLDDVVGQDEIVERLQAYVKVKNVPHLMFAGPAGTGKTTCALALARQLFGETWKQNFNELNASVTPDTPILIKRKNKLELITFGKLADEHFEKDLKYAFPDDLDILSLDKDLKVKFLKVKNISRHKCDKIAKIRFEGGEVKTTLSHSVIVLSGTGDLVEKKVSELSKEDMLISFRGEIEGNFQELDLKEFSPKEFFVTHGKVVRNPTVRQILDKIKIDEDIAWLFGTFLAEGCAHPGKTSGTVIFTYGYPQEIDVMERASGIISNLGFSTNNHTIKSGSSGKESDVQLTVCSTQLARFFRRYFYDGGRTAEFKKIPDFIFNLPIELRFSFLKGYAGDAWGNWEEYLRYSSKSREALMDLTWLGRLSGLDTSFFDKEARIIWKKPTFSYIKDELIIAAPFIDFLEKITEKINFNWRYMLRHQLYCKKSKRMRKELMEEIIAKIERLELTKDEKKHLEKLKRIVNSNLYFVKIRDIKIEDYDGYVYDVAVPGSEMFFGGAAPILLHNSDERGIGIIRGKIKDFARTAPIGKTRFKIIFLDEADQLTNDAQSALRRTIEKYSHICRFILSVNYSSRIIEPIQSRCTVFRFSPIRPDDIKKYMKKIATAEKIEITNDGLETLIFISKGDLRKAINVLQVGASVNKKITAELLYETTSTAKPEDVKNLINTAIAGDFMAARNLLYDLLIKYGLSGEDIIKQIHQTIFDLPIPDDSKIRLIEKTGETEFRLIEGSNEHIQLEALLAQFSHEGGKLR